MRLTDPITKVPYIGDKYENILHGLNLFTIKDLLEFYPRKYIDSSEIFDYSNLSRDEKRTTLGVLKSITSLRTRKRITIQRGEFEYKDSKIIAIWFNQPFLKDSLELERVYMLNGKLNNKKLTPELVSPDIEEFSPDAKHLGRISPVYNLTKGIKIKWLRSRIKWLIDKLDYVADFKESLPKKIIDKYSLIDLKSAISEVHFPVSQESLDLARFRLGFEELLEIQLKIEKLKLKRGKFEAKKLKIDKKEQIKKLKKINIELTTDQSEVLNQIFDRVSKKEPLDVLLQGDVGSGKTFVAIFAALQNYLNGLKTVVIAPTTILSDQLYANFIKVFTQNDVALVNSKHKKTQDLKDKKVIIGTHALLFLEKDYFKNLNLLIVDEEHRFGVDQREQLAKLEKDYKPHKLSMTATPIPRSLALTLWGESEVLYIKSKPKGRKQTKTFFSPKSKRKDFYKWIKTELKSNGSQVFWVCPLVSESEVLNFKAAEDIFKQVKKEFPDLKVELAHGRTKNKEEILDSFREANFDILVTTPIIEVGVDIANANYIVIESAERFGLAQLHQLRGRVGRSGAQGYCILNATDGNLSEDQKRRLKYFCNQNDGLKLAEFDLKSRGPGEVYGTKQSGIPDLKIANIFDLELVKKTKEAAKWMLGN